MRINFVNLIPGLATFKLTEFQAGLNYPLSSLSLVLLSSPPAPFSPPPGLRVTYISISRLRRFNDYSGQLCTGSSGRTLVNVNARFVDQEYLSLSLSSERRLANIFLLARSSPGAIRSSLSFREAQISLLESQNVNRETKLKFSWGNTYVYIGS